MLKYSAMNVPFILQTGASSASIGYIFVKKECDGKEMVVAYVDRSFRRDERKYTVSEQEYLAVVECIKAYKEYLSHQKIADFTDHHVLGWLH